MDEDKLTEELIDYHKRCCKLARRREQAKVRMKPITEPGLLSFLNAMGIASGSKAEPFVNTDLIEGD